MLDSLDTLISFTLIFAVVSLLVTIIVQMIASLFNLRGKNLAWGIAEAFEAVDKNLADTAAKQVKTGFAGFLQKARGAVESCLQKMGLLTAASKAKQLADHCLSDSLLSDFQVGHACKPASAVRTDELFELLHRIATDKKPATPQDIKAHVTTLFASLGVPAGMLASEKAKLEDLQKQLTDKLSSLPAGTPRAVLQNTLKEVTDKLAAAAANTLTFAERWAAQGEDTIKHLYAQFEQVFETGQERAKEWFTIHARIVTALIGFAFAFVLQLDAVEIFKTVSSNPALRAKIVAQADALTKQADKILGEQAVPKSDAQDPAAAKTALTAKAGEYKNLKSALDDSGFWIFPPNGWRWGDKDHWNFRGHCWGMLFSALLLSLGAPFWFNALKSLASLRSSVAGNISDEKKANRGDGKESRDAKAGNAPAAVLPKA